MTSTSLSNVRGSVPLISQVGVDRAEDARTVTAINNNSSIGFHLACLLTSLKGTRFALTEHYPSLMIPCNGGTASSLAEVGQRGGPTIPAHEIPVSIEGVRDTREIRAVRRIRGWIPSMTSFDASGPKVSITVAQGVADESGAMQSAIPFAVKTIREVFGREVNFKLSSDPYEIVRSISNQDRAALARVCTDVWCDIKRDARGRLISQDSESSPRSKHLQSIVLDLVAERLALIEEGPQSEPRKVAETLMAGEDRVLSVVRPQLAESQWQDCARVALLRRREESESVLVTSTGRDLFIKVLTPPIHKEHSAVYSAPRHLPFEVRLSSVFSESNPAREAFHVIPPHLDFAGLSFSGDRQRVLVDLGNPGASGLPAEVRRDLEKQIGGKKVLDPSNRFSLVEGSDPLFTRILGMVSGGVGIRNVWRCDFDGGVRLDTLRPIPEEVLESIGQSLGCVVTQRNRNFTVPEGWKNAIDCIANSAPIKDTLNIDLREKMRFLMVHGAARCVGGSSMEFGGGLVFDRGAWLDGNAPQSQQDGKLFRKTRAVVLSHAHADHAGELIDMWFRNLKDKPLHPCQFIMNEATALLTWRLLQDRHLLSASNFHIAHIEEMYRSSIRIAPMGHRVRLSEFTHHTLLPAGHHLGSCMSLLEHHDSSGHRRVLYAGDIQSAQDYGQSRLYPAARPVSDLDALIIEGTNGIDPVAPREELERKFLDEIVARASRGDTVVLPVLAAGRAQEVLTLLHRNRDIFRSLNIPLFYDGRSLPLVNSAFSYLARSYPELFRDEVLDHPWQIQLDGSVKPIPAGQREKIMRREDRKVVIVPGGMGVGPALEWITAVGSRKRGSVVFTCYQVPGSTGYDILHRNDTEESRRNFTWFQGEAVLCRLSGHNSGADTLKFVERSLKRGGKVVLVHGHSSNLEALRDALLDQRIAGSVIVAEPGERIALW